METIKSLGVVEAYGKISSRMSSTTWQSMLSSLSASSLLWFAGGGLKWTIYTFLIIYS